MWCLSGHVLRREKCDTDFRFIFETFRFGIGLLSLDLLTVVGNALVGAAEWFSFASGKAMHADSWERVAAMSRI
jgi:hypothetical protein